MLPEVLPLSVRGTAMGVAVCLQWAANFAVAQTFPILLSAFGPGPVFLGYAAMGVLALYRSDGHLRPLEEIEADLQKGRGRRSDSRDARRPAVSPR